MASVIFERNSKFIRISACVVPVHRVRRSRLSLFNEVLLSVVCVCVCGAQQGATLETTCSRNAELVLATAAEYRQVRTARAHAALVERVRSTS